MPTMAEILAGCESLGDAHEFALVQRAAGLEPLGLFRFNAVALPDLLRALDSDFAGLEREAEIGLTVAADGQYLAHAAGYGFVWPTGKFEGAVVAGQVVAQQGIALGFLVRKLRQELAGATRLFVRKAEDTLREDEAAALLRALRRHGPASLLWVTPPHGQPHAAGTVRVVREGLLQGFLDPFTAPPDGAAPSVAWFDMCRNGYALWRGACLPGTVAARGGDAVAENLIDRPDTFAGPGWRTGALAASSLSRAVPRLSPQAEVVAHVLELASGDAAEVLQSHFLTEGLQPGEIYTGSAHVWIEPEFAGDDVGLVFEGVPSLGMRNAEVSERGRWQRIWVTALLPDGVGEANLALRVGGPEGSRVFSTCWQMQRGGRATAFAVPMR